MNSHWIAVLGSCAVAYAIKLTGHLVPERMLNRPVIRAAAALFPVALLSALLGIQAFTSKGHITLDARVPAMAAVLVVLRLRWPFLAVVSVGAAVAAIIRLLGWMP